MACAGEVGAEARKKQGQGPQHTLWLSVLRVPCPWLQSTAAERWLGGGGELAAFARKAPATVVPSLVAVCGAAGRGYSWPKGRPTNAFVLLSEQLQLQHHGAKLDLRMLRPLPAACRSPLACTSQRLDERGLVEKQPSWLGEFGSISLRTEETLADTRSSCSLDVQVHQRGQNFSALEEGGHRSVLSKLQKFVTGDSQVIPQPTTNPAQRSLACEF